MNIKGTLKAVALVLSSPFVAVGFLVGAAVIPFVFGVMLACATFISIVGVKGKTHKGPRG